MRKRIAFVPLLAGASFLVACGGAAELPTVSPTDIPALEAGVAAAPEDADRLTLLGVAYFNAGRHDDATGVLRRAVALEDAPAVAHLHLGLAHEALRQWQQASDAYAAFLSASPADSDVRENIQQRVVLVERELMHEQLRAMLAQEEALANQAAQPRTVAVFPFRIVADDPRYEPLQYALADMVTTDLSIPGSLRLLERAQIQALVQEMALTLAGFTDASSAARVGRLMRAQHVVQGSVVLLGDEQLRMEMAVVDPAQAARSGEASDETALEQIFDAEKQLVLEILGVLGVTLTDAEREAIEENRTSSLLALLAYGEGLDAMDRGDFAAATTAFQNASSIDPAFQAAQARAQEASGLQQASETSGSEIAAAAQSDLPSAPTQETSIALVDQIIPDINRSGADGLAGADQPGNDPAHEDQVSNDVAQTCGPICLPIVIRNPNQ